MSDLLTYYPARLVKGKRWQIVYYQTNPLTQQRERHRETHNLNRIKNKRVRKVKAMELINKINSKLPYGYPYDSVEASATLSLKLTPVPKALDFALNLKLASLNRKSSEKGYRGKVNFLKKFIAVKGLEKLHIGAWNGVHTKDFLSYLTIHKKPAPSTYNDYLLQIKGLFDILKEHFYIETNFFEGLKKRKVVPVKITNRYNESARRAFIKEVRAADDEWFLMAIALQYYFFIRPVEISRMKVGNIDFKNSVVELPSTDHKTYKSRYLKIPKVALQLFPEKLKKKKKEWYLLGSGIKPGSTQIDKNGFYRRNKKYLNLIKAKGHDITGLTFYSWKNTGGWDMERKNDGVNIFDVQERMGHNDVNVTKRYVGANDKVASHIKNEL